MALRTDEAKPVRLVDYRVPDFLIDTVHLDFILDPTATRVTSTLTMRRNPTAKDKAQLVLDGDGLEFISAQLDGRPVSAADLAVDPDRFHLLKEPGEQFTLSITTQINPQANSQLMGLYRTSGNYCTQCESEGFRRITYFLDRPDVLSIYTVRVEADRKTTPTLLSNGNLVEEGSMPEDTRHFAVWHDPHPKPSYLFALVGGDLACVRDHFITVSGRKVDLRIYVEHGKENRCDYAMDSLKRSMKWDEEVFGCEYDLDIFIIVAVSDFNMGAMENKGLNVFNDKYVLALPDTATDADFANIEAIIAHEYFHNWTGNRITCRDWFQLCLKEGLTVYRDQEFSSDMRSRPVKRIMDVLNLKSRQFPEDAGPLAHPVRQKSIMKSTISTQLQSMKKALRSSVPSRPISARRPSRKGWISIFPAMMAMPRPSRILLPALQKTSGRDLTQFSLWYSQSGTPEIHVDAHHDASSATLTLDLTQHLPPTPGQPNKQPMVLPLVMGLVNEQGQDLPLVLQEGGPLNGPIILDREKARFVFTGLPQKPYLSLNRGFAAPIQIRAEMTSEDYSFLAAHDSDPYNRWQAAQNLSMGHLTAAIACDREGKPAPSAQAILDAFAAALKRSQDDPALAAQILTIPSIEDIAREISKDIDPDRIFRVQTGLKRQLSLALRQELLAVHDVLNDDGPYSPDAKAAGRRSLRNGILMLAAQGGDEAVLDLAEKQFARATNMTDKIAALATLVHHGRDRREAALANFLNAYENDPLITDKWLSLQAVIADDASIDRVRALMNHKTFSLTNPNRVRALVGAFAMQNMTQFNRADGKGYALLADVILDMDKRNAQVAARLLTAFRSWRSLEPVRRMQAEATLNVIRQEKLSSDTRDIVDRTLQ